MDLPLNRRRQLAQRKRFRQEDRVRDARLGLGKRILGIAGNEDELDVGLPLGPSIPGMMTSVTKTSTLRSGSASMSSASSAF